MIECPECCGVGETYVSCCGDDMTGFDIDLCPTCYEHQGGPEQCETCNGVGEIEKQKAPDAIKGN